MAGLGFTSGLFTVSSFHGRGVYNPAKDSRCPENSRVYMREGGGGGFGAGQKEKPTKAQDLPRGFGAKLKSLNRFKFTGALRPGVISEPRLVPSHIKRPKYAKSGIPRDKRPRYPWEIEVKDVDTIARMRVAGRVAREVLDSAARMVGIGVTTDEIDEVVHRETISRGAYPSPLNYNRFPKSCCTSVNEIVCHGIPDDTVLCDGDIINVDVTVFIDGVHGDCSETFLVGNVDEKGRKLVRTTYEALHAGIGVCAAGVPVHEIGGAIESIASDAGLSTVRNFVGHGIGSVFHTTPNVLHYRNNEANGMMQPGMTFTIEPMLNEGTHKNITWPDDWTSATLDGKRSAQFEHTILITENGVELLTGRLESSPPFFWEL